MAASSQAPLDPTVAVVVTDANKRIIARQRAVKSWSSVAVPSKDAKACAQATTIKTWVDGFGMGSSEARKSMVIESADEIARKLDSSVAPSIAKDLAMVKQAGRGGSSPLGWAQIDYSTDEYPFEGGPRAKAFQYAFATARQGGAKDKAAFDKALDELKKDEVILVAQHRTRSKVEGKTFTPGFIDGVAFLWSYEKGAFLCAGRFEATNTSDEFRASKDQMNRLPEEEVEIRAFVNGAASLRQLSSP